MIITKYEIGEKVWVADYVRVNEFILCPDCLGTSIWQAILPNGQMFPIPCPTCDYGYQGSRGHVEGPYTYGPHVWEGTIDSINVNTSCLREDERVYYVLQEIEIGSSSAYYESKLHKTEAEAQAEAILRADQQTQLAANQFIVRLKQKKQDNVGSRLSDLRTERTRLQKQLTQIETYIASISKNKMEVK
jgi:hypothetical protein